MLLVRGLAVFRGKGPDLDELILAFCPGFEIGQAFAIVTPFTPSPMIDKLREKGFRSWTEQKGPEHYVTHFSPVT